MYYWDKYYKKIYYTRKPSTFVKFLVKKKLIRKNNKIFELGCGDGRDSFYLAKNSRRILSVDKSKIIIKKNNQILKKSSINNLIFKQTNLLDNNFFSNLNKFDIIYARFFFHAINKQSENKIIKNIMMNIKKNTLLVSEFRTIFDEMKNRGKKISKHENFTNHYRRYIDSKQFIQKILKYKAKLIYMKQGKNLSIYKNDNPHLCRIIIKKI